MSWLNLTRSGCVLLVAAWPLQHLALSFYFFLKIFLLSMSSSTLAYVNMLVLFLFKIYTVGVILIIISRDLRVMRSKAIVVPCCLHPYNNLPFFKHSFSRLLKPFPPNLFSKTFSQEWGGGCKVCPLCHRLFRLSSADLF